MVRTAGRDRVPLRGAGARRLPCRSRVAERRTVGRLPVHARQPSRVVVGALGPRRGCRRWFNLTRNTATNEIGVAPQNGTATILPTTGRPVMHPRGCHHDRRRLVAPAGHGSTAPRPLAFMFDGVGYEGLAGDTLASALLANGVDIAARSPLADGPEGCSAGSRSRTRSSRWPHPRSGRSYRPRWCRSSRGSHASGRRRRAGRPPTAVRRWAGIGTCTSRPWSARDRRLARGARGRRSWRPRDARRRTSVLGGHGLDERPCRRRAGLPESRRGRKLASASEVIAMTEPPRSASTTTVTWSCTNDRRPPSSCTTSARAPRRARHRSATSVRSVPPQRSARGHAGRPRRYYHRFGDGCRGSAPWCSARTTRDETRSASRRAACRSSPRRPRRRGGGRSGRRLGRASTCATDGRCSPPTATPHGSIVTLIGPDGAVGTVHADLVLVSGGWNPAAQLWRGIGGGLDWDDDRACFVPDGAGTAVALGRRRRCRRGALGRSVLVHARRRPDRALRRDATGRHRGRRARSRGARPAIDRAREARDVHRHDDRPGPNERRAHRRDRERGGGRRARSPGTDEQPAALHAGPVPRARRPRPRTGTRPGPHHADPPAARRARRGVRERRPVEAPLVLPASRRDDARGRGARRPRRPARRRGGGRLDAGEDRARRAGRRCVPGPALHEPDVDARGRLDPVRGDARRRRHGLRRRRRDAHGRGPVLDHHHDRRRRGDDGPRRGVAADRVARAARVRDERDRAVGDDRGERATRARRAGRGGHRHRRSTRRRSRS